MTSMCAVVAVACSHVECASRGQDIVGMALQDMLPRRLGGLALRTGQLRGFPSVRSPSVRSLQTSRKSGSLANAKVPKLVPSPEELRDLGLCGSLYAQARIILGDSDFADLCLIFIKNLSYFAIAGTIGYCIVNCRENTYRSPEDRAFLYNMEQESEVTDIVGKPFLHVSQNHVETYTGDDGLQYKKAIVQGNKGLAVIVSGSNADGKVVYKSIQTSLDDSERNVFYDERK
eukprot:g73789.t1